MSQHDLERIKAKIEVQPEVPETIRRCSKCLLPETFPHIHFDENGVCNYCNSYNKTELKGEEALQQLVAPYRKNTGEADCIVGFSGGRDSSYALHVAKKILGLQPIAFTYDWGMVTDLAVRNAKRMCDQLGIEHRVIYADIDKKRDNIRRNILAWMKNPDVGMVPLFTAGDKQMFKYVIDLQKETGIDLVLAGANPLEKTDFKVGFCGVENNDSKGGALLTSVSGHNKMMIAKYYASQYLKNPSYINRSVPDTISSFYCTYVLKDVTVNIFDYLPWKEENITLLREKYGWEIANDTTTTWRIGDGTAAFYNYIFYTVAGFSEFETFRSNQIREGMITREEGLRLIREENKPRVESMMWYADTIGFDLDEALDVIHSMPKLWARSTKIKVN